MGFPGGSVVKNPPAIQGMQEIQVGSGRSPGEGHGNPMVTVVTHGILSGKNHMDGRVWRSP